MSSEEATKLMDGPGQISDTHELWSWEDVPSFIWTYAKTFSQSSFTRIYDFPSVRRRLVPEDILNKIRKGESYIFQGEQVLEDVVEPPDSILNLATDLAIEQLLQTIWGEFYFPSCIHRVSMTTRNNVEKGIVLAKVEAAFNKENNMDGSGRRFHRRFEGVITIDVSKSKNDDEIRQELATQLGLHTIHELRQIITKKKYLLLFMDGDGDKDINPWKAGYCEYNKQGVVVFITTKSAAVRKMEYVAHGHDKIEIRTEDHLLPWVIFCRNVGSDLVRSSSGIQRIAVQIVEECRGHLQVNVMVGRLLKNVQDIEIWERTLQNLRSTSPEINIITEGMSRVIVNAFIMFWESLDSDKRDCLIFCLLRFRDESFITENNLVSEWIRYGFLQTRQAAEDFLEELLCFSFLRGVGIYYSDGMIQKMFFPREIYETLESLNELNPPVIIRSKSQNEDALYGAIVIDAQLSHLPQSPNCPQLRAVFLKDNPDLTEIPQLFFQQIPRVRTLDLSQTSLRNLPSSVINLMELKVLKLSYCKFFKVLPPEIGQLSNLERVHLDGTQIAHLPSSPNWPRLTELFLQDNSHLIEVPILFFDHMPLLEDLNLSSTGIKELPPSFSKLMNLRGLYLRDCELFMKLPPKIGALKCLNELCLDGTYLLHLPEEVKELTNLKSLIVCFYGSPHDTGRGKNSIQLSSSTIIPAGVISNLKSLYSLSINVNFDDKRWHENVQIILLEVLGLKELKVLKLYIPRVELLGLLSKCIDRLHQFEFTVGHQMQQRIISRAPPAVAIKLTEGNKSLKYVNGVDIPQETIVALQRVDTFFLDRHSTIKDLSAFGLQNLQNLHRCVLGECNEMNTIVDGRHLPLEHVLGDLQFLGVFYMKNLESISKGVCSGLFLMLKSLVLHNCPKIKTIFTMDFIDNLYFLGEIVIEDCPKVNALITHESSNLAKRSFLRNLRKVSLLYLPKLVTIFDGLRVGPSLEKIGFYYCPKLKSLSRMELSSNDLKVIKGEAKWWKRLNWSQAGWEQSQVDHLKKIFFPIDEERDIMTQLTTDEDDIAKQGANDAVDNNGDDDEYDDLDEDEDEDDKEDDDEPL